MIESPLRSLLPDVIARLSGLELKARTVVEGFLSGLHRSPYKGFSVEFAEHRFYQPGDDIRYIDWKAFARHERLYVKQYEQETNLRCYLLLDASASMGYGNEAMRKFDYAAVCAAALAYLALGQGESVGLALYADELRAFVPARHNPAHFHVIREHIESAQPSGETDTGKVLGELAQRVKRRGLMILLSDLFDDDAAVDTTLKFLRHRKHEVIVFHILDRSELDLPFDEALTFEDMETRRQLPTEPDTLRDAYRRQVRRFLDSRKKICGELGVDYVPFLTDEPLDKALATYLAWRAKIK